MPYTPGPFDSEHVYLQWGGKLPGGEGWSCGLRMAKVLGGDLAQDAGWLNAAKTAVQAYHTNASSFISGGAKLSFVKANVINADGHYKFDTNNEVIVADVPGTNGDATPIHPNQVTYAVTLLTGFTRGPAHKGRFYVPLPNIIIGADGLMSTSNQTSAKTTANTLITALNAITANIQVAVFSRKSGAPAHRLVTGVTVGRALDTQRRRRKSLPEQYN